MSETFLRAAEMTPFRAKTHRFYIAFPFHATSHPHPTLSTQVKVDDGTVQWVSQPPLRKRSAEEVKHWFRRNGLGPVNKAHYWLTLESCFVVRRGFSDITTSETRHGKWLSHGYINGEIQSELESTCGWQETGIIWSLGVAIPTLHQFLIG